MAVGNQQRVRVLLAGPEGAEQRGLELLLIAHGMCVSATATDPKDAVEAVRRSVYDVVLLNLALGEDARQMLLRLRDCAPRLPILGYGDRRPWPIRELLDEGMRGFVLTVGSCDHFLGAVRSVASGAAYLDPDFAIAAPADVVRTERPCLTARERQILGLLAYGLNGREIAARLFLSPATVRTHVQNAMQKLGARTRAQAIVLATGEDPDDQPPNTLAVGAGAAIA